MFINFKILFIFNVIVLTWSHERSQSKIIEGRQLIKIDVQRFLDMVKIRGMIEVVY